MKFCRFRDKCTGHQKYSRILKLKDCNQPAPLTKYTLQMTGYLLDDPRFMKDEKDRKEKVDKIFTDVERLSKESNVSDRY